MKIIARITLTTIFLCNTFSAYAAVVEQAVPFEYSGTQYTGYLYFDDAVKEKRPGVLVVHEWWGLNDYTKSKAKELVGEGYVAFAMDMYGENKVTSHPAQAKEWMKATTANIDEWQKRANMGLQLLRDSDKVHN